MNNSIISISIRLAEIAYYKGIQHVVISPGSRSAPITIAFARHPEIKTYVILDERSAGYIALGMSLVLDQPVGLVCTSGTAAINLYPAIAEGYYQNVPLLIFTADRPPEWIDQADGQTIHQENLYGKHVKKYFNLPSDLMHKDALWHTDRIINEAINTAIDAIQGPVHLNIPIREPFYPSNTDRYEFNIHPKIIDTARGDIDLNPGSWQKLEEIWRAAENILIVAGQSRPDVELNKNLKEFINTFDVPLVGDTIANIFDIDKNIITHHDLILGEPDKLKKNLEPDLLITFGNSVISKNLKSFLRDAHPINHWHIQETGYHRDTFQCLTHRINLKPVVFFQRARKHFNRKGRSAVYLNNWIMHEKNI